jgi:hypothetical protein
MRNKNMLSQTILPIALTILLLVALEYSVQIPSRFFVTEEKKTTDMDKDEATNSKMEEADTNTATGGDEIIRVDDKKYPIDSDDANADR